MPFDGAEISEVTELLVIGRARIEAGWCQKKDRCNKWSMRGYHVHYCLIGSILYDLPRIGLARAEELLKDAIERLGYSHKCLVTFNDAWGRTQDQVIEVCDVAIAISRGEYRPLERRNL